MKGVRGFAVRLLIPALLAGAAFADLAQYHAAKRKLDEIGTLRTPPGSQVVLTAAELNSYIQGEIPQVVGPGAVSRSQLQLGDNSGIIRARIDFLKLQQNTGRHPGWLMQRMLAGERDVEVSAHLTSSRGQATIWVDRLQISGVPLSGPALDFLVEVFISPQFPDLKLGEPFPLRSGVDRFEVKPQAVRVFMKR